MNDIMVDYLSWLTDGQQTIEVPSFSQTLAKITRRKRQNMSLFRLLLFKLLLSSIISLLLPPLLLSPLMSLFDKNKIA
jgi:hypothetical protein